MRVPSNAALIAGARVPKTKGSVRNRRRGYGGRRSASSFIRCSREAIVRIVVSTVSAFREIESIPRRTRNSANSG